VATHIYDLQEEFLGTEAAKLIAGAYDDALQHDSYQFTLELLRRSYEIALGHFRNISQLDDIQRWRQSPPYSALQSAAMQQCVRLLEIDPWGASFATWISKPYSAFEEQKFVREELHRWIEANNLESRYRFHLVSKTHDTASNSRSLASASLDYSMIFPPEDLIAAFGQATGMNLKWFKNLADRPDLQKARKQMERPQRGHTRPPLFCPYLVMKFLAKPNHRVGRTLAAGHGWWLLEQYFPRVYEAYLGEKPDE